MRKPRRILFAVLIAVVLGGLAWLGLHPRLPDPVYEGRRVSEWLHTSGNDGPVHRMDSNAVPLLVKALQTREGVASRTYSRIWSWMPSRLQDHLPAPLPAQLIRGRAALCLARMGEDARPAIPTLALILKEDADKTMRFIAAATLARFSADNETAKAGLTSAAIQDTDLQIREFALHALLPNNLREPLNRGF